MLFAVNYSPQAVALVHSGAIVLDRFKCPNWDWMIDEARAILPVYVHVDLAVGDGSVRSRNWVEIERQLAQTDTPYINLHPVAHGYAVDSHEAAEQERAVEQALRDIAFVSGRFGADRVILENIPFRPRSAGARRTRQIPPLMRPDVLARLIRAAGIGLLLDLAHARLTCEITGDDVSDYIGALPLNRLCEVHVTGLGTIDGRRRDHLPMTDADWVLFEQFMGMIAGGQAARPWLIAQEYGGVGEKFAWRSEQSVLAVDTPRIAKAVRMLDARPQ